MSYKIYITSQKHFIFIKILLAKIYEYVLTPLFPPLFFII